MEKNIKMKKVISVVGARPNFMKVAPIHRAFQKYNGEVEHLIVHTGQHYDSQMSDAFFKDLDMPKPAYFLGVGSGSHAEQTAKVMLEFEKVCLDAKPDMVIVVGDVNSTIACSLTSVKLGIKTAHVEGGLRSFDRGMPEEINRLATDAICDYCFITEESALKHLSNEGYPKENIFFTGNTMIDSQHYAKEKAAASDVPAKMGLDKKDYVLVTIHRPSNVDEKEQLVQLLNILTELSEKRKVVFPIHPRTRKNIEKYGLNYLIESNDRLILTDPLGYVDFLALMMNSDFVLTDSGGIQEETTALGVHCITIRTTTERPVTVDVGTNILIKPEPEIIKSTIEKMIEGPRKSGSIPEFWDGKAAERIAKIIVEKCF